MKSKLTTNFGVVEEALPNTQFLVHVAHPVGQASLVQLPDTVRCVLSGRMRKNRIFVKVGDKVQFEMPEKSEIGRIFFRKI